MADLHEIKISTFLSFVLRHHPESIGLSLDENGWAAVDELIQKSTDFHLTMEILKSIVEKNDKQRFAFSPDFTKIRANQGHSVTIDLNLEAICPPSVLFHGTATKNIESIKKSGLLKQERHHVHLSSDKETAAKVGARYGKPIVLQIDTQTMHQQGHQFFKTENGVWLTDHVPALYINFAPI